MEVSVGYEILTLLFIINILIIYCINHTVIEKEIKMIINHIFKCTQEEFNTTKSRENVLLICTECNKEYNRTKKEILDTYRKYR